jgi:ATP-dependent RNA helicase RhlE
MLTLGWSGDKRKTHVLTQTFSELGLPAHLMAALDAAGFTTPTPIQAQAIPPQLAGRDILGIAQTGSGKTAAFGLPILAGIAGLTGRPAPMTTRALILAPTRELAVQIDEVMRKLSTGMKLTTLLVLGGVSRHSQVQKAAKGVDVVIATPGRLKDLVDDKKLRLDQTRWLVLDEADRMLDMGFIRPVKALAAAIGPRRQTALFSATMAPEVAELTRDLLKDPVRVEATPPATTVVSIEQRVILSGSKQKRQVLNDLLADESLARVILFSRTKHGADRVTKNLEIDGHEAAAIHGNKSQNARQAALKGFAAGRVRILVATDIASRGIDVPGITHVINYELPDDAENYVHRIGRTGRNGASGVAITLCDGTERSKLRDVEKLIRQKLPVSGDMTLAAGPISEAPARKAPRREGERPERAKHFSGARKASIQDERAPRSRPAGGRPGASRPAESRADAAGPTAPGWWEKPTGNGSAPPKAPGKQRWDKSRKDAASGKPAGRRGDGGARRSPGPRSERTSAVG